MKAGELSIQGQSVTAPDVGVTRQIKSYGDEAKIDKEEKQLDVLKLARDVILEDSDSVQAVERALRLEPNIPNIAEILQVLLDKNLLRQAHLASVRLLFDVNAGRVDLSYFQVNFK